MIRAFFLLVAGASAALHAQTLYAQTPVGDAPPDSSEQDRILNLMHAYGDHYVSNLPNFLCDQETRQFESGLKSEKWHRGDTLVANLSFHDGQDQRSLALVNGKKIDAAKGMRWHAALQSEGEFGTLIETVVGERSQAVFNWGHWESLHGRRLAVFDYTVDKQHSLKTLSLLGVAKATLPYAGSIWADPATGAVLRISEVANDVPPALLTRSLSTVVDYDDTVIAGTRYLLPTQAAVEILTDSRKIRNELSFRNYRKFSADTSITFDK